MVSPRDLSEDGVLEIGDPTRSRDIVRQKKRVMALRENHVLLRRSEQGRYGQGTKVLAGQPASQLASQSHEGVDVHVFGCWQ